MSGTHSMGATSSLAFEQLARCVQDLVRRESATVVFTFDCDAVHAAQPSLSKCLDDAERAKVARLATPLLRRRKATARAVLRRMLAACLDLPPSQVPVHRTEQGQPQLVRGAADLPLHISCSCSGPLAAIALSVTGRVGVDLELLERQRFPDAIAENMLGAREHAVFATVPLHQRLFWLASAWVGKEALLKGLGLGLQIDPCTAEVMPLAMPAADGGRGFKGISLQGWHAQHYCLPGAVLAVAAEDPRHVVQRVQLQWAGLGR